MLHFPACSNQKYVGSHQVSNLEILDINKVLHCACLDIIRIVCMPSDKWSFLFTTVGLKQQNSAIIKMVT